VIAVRNIECSAGSFRLKDIAFEIPSGSYGVLMGKTGCGKTTLLEAICGLRGVRSGSIFLDERDVTRLKAADRGVGYVPQDLALFPTLRVRDHLAFALRIRRMHRALMDRRVDELADLLGIRHLLDRRPSGLSGGEAQRVALGRALSASPTVLCLDEPLSALDDDTRAEMAEFLKRVQQQTGVTVLHVTHSKVEAVRLADRILVLDAGKIR